MKKQISKVASVLTLGLMMGTAVLSAEQQNNNIQEIFTQKQYDIQLSQEELGFAQIAHEEGVSLDSIFTSIIDARVSAKQGEEINTQLLLSQAEGVFEGLVEYTKDLSDAIVESLEEAKFEQETEKALNESVKDLVARIEDEEAKKEQEDKDFDNAFNLAIATYYSNFS